MHIHLDFHVLPALETPACQSKLTPIRPPTTHSSADDPPSALGMSCDCFHPLEPRPMAPLTIFNCTKPTPELSHLKAKRCKFLVNILVKTRRSLHWSRRLPIVEVQHTLQQRLGQATAPVHVVVRAARARSCPPRSHSRPCRRRFSRHWQCCCPRLRCRHHEQRCHPRWVPRQRQLQTIRRHAPCCAPADSCGAFGPPCRLAGRPKAKIMKLQTNAAVQDIAPATHKLCQLLVLDTTCVHSVCA